MDNIKEFIVSLLGKVTGISVSMGMWSFLGGMVGSILLWVFRHKEVVKHMDEIVGMVSVYLLVWRRERLKDYLEYKSKVRELKWIIKKEKKADKKGDKIKRLEEDLTKLRDKTSK